MPEIYPKDKIAEQVIEGLKNNETLKDIAIKFNLSYNYLRKIINTLRKSGLIKTTYLPELKTYLLSKHLKIKISNSLKQHYTFQDISNRFGISKYYLEKVMCLNMLSKNKQEDKKFLIIRKNKEEEMLSSNRKIKTIRLLRMKELYDRLGT